VAIMLFAVALFVLILGLATLAAAMVVATAIVIGVKVWWQNYLGRGGQDHRVPQGRTLEADYELLSSNSLDREDSESGKNVRGKHDAGT
jgi:hypothetical protein